MELAAQHAAVFRRHAQLHSARGSGHGRRQGPGLRARRAGTRSAREPLTPLLLHKTRGVVRLETSKAWRGVALRCRRDSRVWARLVFSEAALDGLALSSLLGLGGLDLAHARLALLVGDTHLGDGLGRGRDESISARSRRAVKTHFCRAQQVVLM